MLHARSTLNKILLIFAAMAGVEFFFFYRRLNTVSSAIDKESQLSRSLGSILTDSRIHLVFLAVFLILTILLTLNGYEFKGKISYTIRRLSIAEKCYFFLQGLYYSGVYLLFLMFQIFLIFLLSTYYFRAVPESYYSNQTLFTLFYSNDFLHSLLPLEETIRSVTNLIMTLALGFSAAFSSYCQRGKSKRGGNIVVLTFLYALTFQSGLGTYFYIVILTTSITSLILIVFSMLRKEERCDV